MLGMFFAHFGPATGDLAEREQWPFRIVRFNDGRAMPLFVLLSGAGFTFLVRFKPRISRVLPRAAILLLAGLVLEGGLVLVILHFYALYFIAGLLVHRLPDRALLLLAGAVIAVGALTTVYLTEHLPESYVMRGDPWFSHVPQLGHPLPLLSHLAFTGGYPLFPSFAFFLVGMVLARHDLRPRLVVTALVVGGLSLALAGYALGWNTDVHRRGLAPDSTSAWRFLSAAGHSQMPVWVIATTGGALAVVGFSLALCRAAPRATMPLVWAGQLALTFYVAHVFLLRRPLRRWPYELSPAETIGAIVALFAAFVLVASLWRRYFKRGPAEAVMRVGDLLQKDS